MLLRFGVENYLSIRDYQEVSLVASSLTDAAAETYPAPKAGVNVLPAIALYGANASGKSNFLAAFRAFRNCIKASHQKGQGAERPDEQHFALDDGKADEPTTFDCDFICDGVRYHYGFSVDCKRIVEEWLYAFPRKYQQTWFYRSVNEDKEFYFGDNLKGPNRTVARITRPDSLFLSVAASSNHEYLTGVYDYFSEKFLVYLGSFGSALTSQALVDHLEKKDTKKRFIEFVKHADIGVTDIAVEEVEVSEKSEKLIRDFSQFMRRHLPDFDLDDFKSPSKQVRLGHTTSSGEPVYLSWGLESHGTQFILGILGPVFDALDNGKTIIVDELETSTHPLVSRELVRMFGSHKTNPNGAQLVFSTHDTNLLSAGILRRDQIWFTQKDRSGATQIFPLTDIKTRKTDNLEKGYLDGRFGGIPYIERLVNELTG